jgi:hypothetical protein
MLYKFLFFYAVRLFSDDFVLFAHSVANYSWMSKAVYLKQAQKTISPSLHIAILVWTIHWLFYSVIIQYTVTAHAETKVASNSTVIISQMFSGDTPT